MIFHEVYSIYYQTVAKLLTAAGQGATEEALRRIVLENAFAESSLTILPALQSGRWPLLKPDGTSVLRHRPTMPVTILEKRWLKSLLDDPRLKLFGLELPELAEVEPLFTRDDYRVYDRYADGDPYEDEDYIARFRLILEAIRRNRPVAALMTNRQGTDFWMRFYPVGLEYSEKDDKFRVLARGCRYHHFNLGRLKHCEFYEGFRPIRSTTRLPQPRELVLEITDERNALERVMLHFAHFEKQAERLGDGKYLLRLTYYDTDETELVIRVLSFGSQVKALAPAPFVELIKDRLRMQRACGVK